MTSLHLFLGGACLAVACLSGAHAQTEAMADVNEWRGFSRPPAGADALQGLGVYRTFRAVVQEGPWPREQDRALTGDERGLIGHLAAGRWNEALAALKAGGMRLDARDDTGATALGLAARAGQLDLVRELIRQGAPLDQAGLNGITPLAAAAMDGHDLVVHDLLRAGARINEPTAQAQTPLHLAAAAGRARTITFLLKHGAERLAVNREGRMPLHQAAYMGHVQAAQAFLAAGQPLTQLDQRGLNAMHAAALGNQPAMVAWLQEQRVPVESALTQVLIDQMGNCPSGLPACVQAMP